MLLKTVTSPIHELEIAFPSKGELARRPIHRGQLQKRFKIRSNKSVTGLIRCESEAEYRYVQILECAPWITSIQEQPAVIRYKCLHENTGKTHYPDFLINSPQYPRPRFIEVKSRSNTVSTELQRRTQQLTQQLLSAGYEYRLVIVESLPQILIKNCQQILRYSRFSHIGELNIYRFYEEQNGSVKYWRGLNVEEKVYVATLVKEGLVSLDMLCDFNRSVSIDWGKVVYGRAAWHSYL